MMSQRMDAPVEEALKVRQVGVSAFEEALPLIERFFVEEGFHTPSAQIREHLTELLADPESAVFVARYGARAIGVATVTTSQGIELGLSAELEDLYVVPDARKQGAGHALIEAVREWCCRRGCTLVSVVVTPEGQAAHDLIGYYRGQGFEETGRTLLFYHLTQDGETPCSNRHNLLTGNREGGILEGK
jgi:aminoglycoside 6'-N-acetyltransferase I